LLVVDSYAGELSGEGVSGIPIGLPFGNQSSGEADVSICPVGAQVVNMFIAAWQKDDYTTMYDLIDPESRTDYTFDQAKFDFRLMMFKPYEISSVSKKGDDYEFVISYGDWKSGDKDLKKIIISGTTFKIKMPSRNSVFKKSAADYF